MSLSHHGLPYDSWHLATVISTTHILNSILRTLTLDPTSSLTMTHSCTLRLIGPIVLRTEPLGNILVTLQLVLHDSCWVFLTYEVQIMVRQWPRQSLLVRLKFRSYDSYGHHLTLKVSRLNSEFQNSVIFRAKTWCVTVHWYYIPYQRNHLTSSLEDDFMLALSWYKSFYPSFSAYHLLLLQWLFAWVIDFILLPLYLCIYPNHPHPNLHSSYY